MFNKVASTLFLIVSLVANSGFTQESSGSCDKHLQGSEVAAISISSASADSYVKLIKMYVEKYPEKLESITHAIAESKEFVNPLAGQKTPALALQVSNGIEYIRKKFKSEDWVATQAQVSALAGELSQQQAVKGAAREETSYILAHRLVDKLNLPSDVYDVLPFSQNGRSFIFVIHNQHRLSLFEVKKDQLVFIKEYKPQADFSRPKIVKNKEQVFLLFDHHTYDGGKFVGSRISILEFKDLELQPLVTEFYTQDQFQHDVQKVWISGGQIHFSVKRNGKPGYFGRRSPVFKLYRVSKSLLSSDMKVTRVRGSIEKDLTSFNTFEFDLGKKSYIAHGTSYESAEKTREFVVRQQTLTKKFKTVSSVNFHVNEMTSFELDGQRYFALAGRDNIKAELSFNIYTFDGRDLKLANGAKLDRRIDQIIQFDDSRSFLLIAGVYAIYASFEDGKLEVSPPVELGLHIKLFTIRGRHFVYTDGFNSQTDKKEMTLYELNNSEFVKTNIQLDPDARFVSVPTSDDAGETFIISFTQKIIQLISLFTSSQTK